MRGLSCTGPLLLVLGKVCIDLSSSVADLAHVGFALSMRHSVWAGFMLSTLGRFRLGFLPPPPDGCTMGSVLFVRCHGRPGFPLPTVGILRAGQQLDQGSCLSIGGFARFGPFMFAFCSTRLELSPLVLDSLNLGSISPVRHHVRPGMVALALDFLQLGTSMILQSFAQTGGVVLVLEIGHLETLMSLRSSAHLDLRPLVLGMGRLGFLPLVPDLVSADAFLLPRGLSCADLLLSACQLSNSGPFLSLRSPLGLEVLLLASGTA